MIREMVRKAVWKATTMNDYNEKPKRGFGGGDPREEAACPICGGTSYEWGKPGSDGGLYYLPQGAIYGFGMGEPLAARKCLSCGNLQIFIRDAQ
jgi:hypothetical protein